MFDYDSTLPPTIIFVELNRIFRILVRIGTKLTYSIFFLSFFTFNKYKEHCDELRIQPKHNVGFQVNSAYVNISREKKRNKVSEYQIVSTKISFSGKLGIKKKKE